jgi:hypothetical protein
MICIPLFSPALMKFHDEKNGNKKAEVFFLCFSSMTGVFFAQPKGPTIHAGGLNQ